jgi:5-methyltetrahydrofolate--homocysteine methyltransferase
LGRFHLIGENNKKHRERMLGVFNLKQRTRKTTMETILQGKKNTVRIAPDRPTVLIGKRIRPAARRLSDGEPIVSYAEIAKNEALAQVAAGADVVNVNVSETGKNEKQLLPQAVEIAQEAVEVPISIEALNLEALAASLAACHGKPLINAVTGEEESLKQVLPLVAEYGVAVIGRCVDEEGISNDPYKRLEIASRIVERAEALGIPHEDILIDCLTQSIEADREAASVTLEAIRLVRDEMGSNMTLDVSSISFDLPNHATLHQALLAVAIAEGVNAPIVNVARDRQAILALDTILGRDEASMRYIQYYHFRRSGMRSMIDWEMID